MKKFKLGPKVNSKKAKLPAKKINFDKNYKQIKKL